MLNVQETDLVFDGVAVRMYEPVKRSGVLPGMMYYHGGGFVFGSLGKNCKFNCFSSLTSIFSNVIVRNFDLQEQ